MKKGLHCSSPCLQMFVRLCRPQNIMVSLGKRGVRQTVPSLLRNIHDLQYGSSTPPPQKNKTKQKSNIFTYKKQNRTQKDQSSSPTQTSGSSLSVSAVCLNVISGMSSRLWLPLYPQTHTHTHTVKTKCEKGSAAIRGPLFSC